MSISILFNTVGSHQILNAHLIFNWKLKQKYKTHNWNLYPAKNTKNFILTYQQVANNQYFHRTYKFKYSNLIKSNYLDPELDFADVTEIFDQDKSRINFFLQDICQRIRTYKIKQYHNKEISARELAYYLPILKFLTFSKENYLTLELSLLIIQYIPTNEYQIKDIE